jgi:oligopeptidase B
VFTLYVRDLATGREVDTVANVVGATAWANDNRTYFYVTGDSARRSNAVWRRTTGGARGADANVFREDSVLYNVGSTARATGGSSSSAPRASRRATGG